MSDLIDILACPDCLGTLAATADGVECTSCGHPYPDAGGYLDLGPAARGPNGGLGMFMLQDPLHVPRYERHTRISFLQIMGDNWENALTPEAEDDYLRAHLSLADVPLLDLACGAGRWTRTLVDHLGLDRVVGLDLSVPMIETIRAGVPGVRVVRGTALRLPFATGSLGGVNCSNALQLLPEPRNVLREVGRCLRPGGVFTAFTYRRSDRPTYRHFQRQQEETFGVRSFTTTELVSWLTAAGLDLVDLRSPAGMLLLTARRTA
ncbi:methyltransferase domain-containing protein [Kutzneria sp. CA-103260]|uniref:methyltransferase domain-containing protein n=1 Tax=Kutzneria sp. CA-103260 TaxID=2802641 RepID=UPI001BA77847|nr:methyltransferase domain-containing protein [Kutzneria sp. CA-103260]QUQ67567.1 2-methoxy-6-polyprenyl-1,4-benzoquinol methylase, mitochondrial [Kutzneria sp. CA-103260]